MRQCEIFHNRSIFAIDTYSALFRAKNAVDLAVLLANLEAAALKIITAEEGSDLVRFAAEDLKKIREARDAAATNPKAAKTELVRYYRLANQDAELKRSAIARLNWSGV
jgi:hypothetical protein